MSFPPKVPDFEQSDGNAVMVNEDKMLPGEDKAQCSEDKSARPKWGEYSVAHWPN